MKRLGAAALAIATVACGSESQPDPPTMGAAVVQGGPLATDIWVADLRWETSGPPAIGDPTNLTRRPGYDNQPHYVPDGAGLWYTAVDEHDGQADIWRYDFESEMVTRVTSTNPESEYSATPLPDGSGISVVRVESDSTQRLWRFDADGSNGAVVLEDVAPVGYHAWADDRRVVMFILGDPATLQRADTESGSVEVIADDIGRSIQRIPESNDVSFVKRHTDGTTTIMRLGTGSSEPEAITTAVEGGEFHAWAPDGTLLMAHESVIYAWTPGASWQPIADFSRFRIAITRLAVSPEGSQIAIVGEVVL